MIDDLSDEEEEVPKKPQDGPSIILDLAPVTRIRSRADDLLDAMAGRPIGGAKVRTCPCGSTRFRKIHPLGSGVTIYQCRSCRVQVPWSCSGQKGATLPTAGPFASPRPVSVSATEPTFRHKSRAVKL